MDDGQKIKQLLNEGLQSSKANEKIFNFRSHQEVQIQATLGFHHNLG